MKNDRSCENESPVRRWAATDPARRPQTVTVPDVGASVPATQRRIVVFPEPFGP